ncbi:hypothetical protein BH09PSE3_BH09PSE3_10770 [soil metagenome]
MARCMTETSTTDTPPDRLAINPSSPFHDADLLARGIGVRFKDSERTDVDEYCISEGWIRVSLGKKVDRKGNPLTIKLTGPIEVWYLDVDKSAKEADAETAGADTSE